MSQEDAIPQGGHSWLEGQVLHQLQRGCRHAKRLPLSLVGRAEGSQCLHLYSKARIEDWKVEGVSAALFGSSRLK